MHIRQYNAQFNFTSIGTNEVKPSGSGPKTYCIQGQLIHNIGPNGEEERKDVNRRTHDDSGEPITPSGGRCPGFGLLDSKRLLRKNPLVTGLVPLEDDDGARVSNPGRKREADGSTDVYLPAKKEE
ncbi:hypothetical protein DYB31_012811 [Aphanomyces astaci]|uniref:Uncharacterized protein n=1 Tax=Aphanomyces astaci TaxID=112090 RepID=A0A397FT23_APHAT|nr:hypothetical protein DYB31_012811 [Aphanomyces astaci]